MNKRYMDFVPKKEGAAGAPVVQRVMKVGVVKMPDNTGGAVVKARASVQETVIERKVSKGRPARRTVRGAERKPVREKEVYRALPSRDEVDELGLITTIGVVENPVENFENTPVRGARGVFGKNARKDAGAATSKSEYQVPKSPFINQNKVVKRPLSKNVYQKKIEVPVEEPKGPVTIISKPEKDSKAGIVVAIIMTIILGAAVGTVAFLLLPK